MFFPAAHTFGADNEVAYFFGHENRNVIARTERCEFVQFSAQIGRHIGEGDFGIYMHLGNEHIFFHHIFYCVLEFFSKGRDILDFESKSGCIFVSAVIFEQFAAFGDCGIEVESFDRSSGARSQSVGFGKDDGGFVERFGEPGSDDGDNAFMPSGIEEYDGSSGVVFRDAKEYPFPSPCSFIFPEISLEIGIPNSYSSPFL